MTRGVLWRRRRLGRAGQAMVTLASVLTLVFLLVRLIPGDPVVAILGVDANPEAEAALRAELRLDQPIVAQFGHYLFGLIHGDLGASAVERDMPVASIILEALPNTLALAATGMTIAVILGVPLGLLAASHPDRMVDLAIRAWAMTLNATPTFLTGLVLIMTVSLGLRWLPAGGWPGSYPANFAYLVLPGLSLSGHLAPAIARTVRQAALDAGGQAFIEAAIARGLSPWALAVRHILPNSIPPVITLLGINFGMLLTGAMVVEAVFGLPGLGSEMTKAVSGRDYPVVQGIALVSACTVIVGGLLAEFAYAAVDPRARRG